MASPQELQWLNEYFLCWNATEAARRVGYKWPNKVGPAKKKKFADEINQRLEENTMQANEVLSRLSDMARGNLADFAGIETKEDLENHPKGHIVKKLKTKRRKFKGDVEIIESEIELNDPQAALEKIGRHYGLFDAGSSESKPFIIKVVYGDDRTNGQSSTTASETDGIYG